MKVSLKRIQHLVCGTLCLGLGLMAHDAGAYDVKAQAELATQAFYLKNTEFTPDNNVLDPFTVQSRLRTRVEGTLNPYASGVLFLEMGYIPWGYDTPNGVGPSSGGALGTDGINTKVRRLYAKFQIPETDLYFDVGLQGQKTMPSATFGSPVLYDDMAAFVSRYDKGDKGLRFLWSRPVNDRRYGDDGDIDVVALDGWLTKGGLKIMPYAMGAHIGQDTTLYSRNFGKKSYPEVDFNQALTSDALGYWAGLPLSWQPIQNLYFGTDLIYGAVASNTKAEEAAGYLASLKAQYTFNNNWQAEFAGWYGSGNDSNADNGIEILPVLSDWSSRGLKATTLATDADMYNASLVTKTGQGTAGASLALKDVSFRKGLSHDFSIGYIQGTSAKDNGVPLYFGWDFAGKNIGFDEEDHAFEFNFDTDWWVTRNIQVSVGLGAVDMHLKDQKGSNIATKAAFSLAYYFM